MKRLTITLLAALLGGVAQAADCIPPEGFQPASSPAPLHDIIKRDAKQRVALLNVWAIWCAPCRKELPLLDNIAQDENAPLEIITLNLGDDPAVIDKIYDELHHRPAARQPRRPRPAENPRRRRPAALRLVRG